MIKRVTSAHPDFRALVQLLDQYLATIDGEEHDFYHQFNSISVLEHCIVIYDKGIPLGCGAIKKFDANSFEVKRMFTHPNARGKGLATAIVNELESWASELGASKTLLETGKRMPDAIALYKKLGYQEIENYGQYLGIENSVCFEKDIS